MVLDIVALLFLSGGALWRSIPSSSVPSKSNVDSRSAVPAEPIAPKVVKPTRQTGNIAQDMLVAYSNGEQALFLGKTASEGCLGTEAFFMGMDREKDAFWSVRCSNGKSYGVEIEPDSMGSTRVLACSVLKTLVGTDCFTKLKN